MKTEIYAVVLLAAVATGWHLRVPRAAKKAKFNLDETQVKPGQEEKCKTVDGRSGICLNEQYCLGNQTISPGGVLDKSVIRVGTCSKTDDWCCSFPNATQTEKPGEKINCNTDNGLDGVCVDVMRCKTFSGGVIDDSLLRIGNCPKTNEVCCQPANVTTAGPDECTLVPESGAECPWCMAIYRDGGNPNTKTATGRYCGGVLIGTRVILTAAGCIVSSAHQKVWVKATASLTPDRKYTVVNRITHETYNSGTREHDFGLMILSEDVIWKADIQKQMAACIGLQTSLAGNCFSVGFNEKDEIKLSKMTVKSGGCAARGAVYDAACGTAEGTCKATYGSPVLCPSDRGGLLVAGLVRQYCIAEKALLGAIMPSAKWLEDQLKFHGLKENNYRS